MKNLTYGGGRGGKTDSQEVEPLMGVTLNGVLPQGTVIWRVTAGLSGQVAGPGTGGDAAGLDLCRSLPVSFHKTPVISPAPLTSPDR